jgi:tRNA 2-thiouridine synthesizing protein B
MMLFVNPGPSLELACTAAAFGAEVHVVFVGDGVFALLGDQPLLAEADFEQVVVERQSLDERGLSAADLAYPATIGDRADIAALIGPALHTIHHPPVASGGLALCLDYLVDGAAILLLEDGVFGAMANGPVAGRLAAAARRHHVYVLAPDADKRGLPRSSLVTGVEAIDYPAFVRLAARHPTVLAWP